MNDGNDANNNNDDGGNNVNYKLNNGKNADDVEI